jgi:hypothetical protein
MARQINAVQDLPFLGFPNAVYRHLVENHDWEIDPLQGLYLQREQIYRR